MTPTIVQSASVQDALSGRTDMDSTTPTLTARDYLRPIWRRKWLIAFIAIAVTAATYTYYNRQPRSYVSSTQIFVGSSGAAALITGDNQQTVGGVRDIANQARLLTSIPVARRVAQDIGFKGSPEALQNAVSVTPDPTADFVVVSARTSNPQAAARLANAFAKAFIDQRAATSRGAARQALNATLGQLKTTPRGITTGGVNPRAVLQERVRQLRILLALPTGDATQVQAAEPSGVPVSPKPKRNAIFAFALSLLLGVLAAFGLERLDRRIRGVDAMEPLYETPMLAAVPRAKDVQSTIGGRPAPSPALLEPFRTLRTTLDFGLDGGRPVSSLLVTSAMPQEGKSTIVRNLALAYAETGRRVAVVDCDLRRPGLHSLFDLPNDIGVVDVAGNAVPLTEALQLVEPMVGASQNGNGNGNGRSSALAAQHAGTLHVLTSGTPTSNAAIVLTMPAMAETIAELKRTHDVLILDTPPVLPVSDAIVLMHQVDGVVLVSRVGATTEEEAEDVVERIRRISKARLLGVVANDARDPTVTARYHAYD